MTDHGIDFEGRQLTANPTIAWVGETMALLTPGSPAAHGGERDPLVTFEVNWRPSLRKKDPADLLLRLAGAAHIAFVGSDEAADLWGCRDPAAIRNPISLVVKDGGCSATIYTGVDPVLDPSCKVELVDTVGAGDSSADGFITGILRGLDVVGLARLGILTAAASLRFRDHGPLRKVGVEDPVFMNGDIETRTSVPDRVTPGTISALGQQE